MGKRIYVCLHTDVKGNETAEMINSKGERVYFSECELENQIFIRGTFNHDISEEELALKEIRLALKLRGQIPDYLKEKHGIK